MKFRDISKITKTFKIRLGPLEAQGVPAILVSAAGVVLAAGIARTMQSNAGMLPEAFREARGFLAVLRGNDAVSLKAHDR